MKIQLSSGQGPAECELAVGMLLSALKKEYPDITVVGSVPGGRRDGFKSILLESDMDISSLEGSVLWICQSQYRSNHKRKNWYVDVSIVGNATQVKLDKSLVRFETFRCSGKGGQHVNKAETGARAVYVPLGLSVEATEARSQHMNKQRALDRLCAIVAQINNASEMGQRSLNRLEHARLERGNPVRVYEGQAFKRIK